MSESKKRGMSKRKKREMSKRKKREMSKRKKREMSKRKKPPKIVTEMIVVKAENWPQPKVLTDLSGIEAVDKNWREYIVYERLRWIKVLAPQELIKAREFLMAKYRIEEEKLEVSVVRHVWEVEFVSDGVKGCLYITAAKVTQKGKIVLLADSVEIMLEMDSKILSIEICIEDVETYNLNGKGEK